MLISRRLSPVLAGSLICLLALAISATAALAAPVTVNLRVEGSSATLFEGPVATEAILPPGLATASSPEAHPCDVADNGANEGFVPSGGNPTSALHAAALAHGFAFDAKWFESFHDFEVSKVGPDANGGAAEGFPSWGYAVNYSTAHVGGCQFQLAPGSEVLWAYNYFNLTHLLSLSGPSSVNAGIAFTMHVADGSTGAPVSGASIGTSSGGVTTAAPASSVTDAGGAATVTLPSAGSFTLKATQPESVRSNGITVCVHSGNDGSCGTTTSSGAGSGSSAAPAKGTVAVGEVARVLGVQSGHVYARRFAPRVLRGIVAVAAGGSLREVRIRLQRRAGGRCFNFNGSRVRFTRSAKCTPATFFSVGGAESFSYLLPARLAAGRYSFDIEAVDGSARVTGLVGGVSHVVFRVR